MREIVVRVPDKRCAGCILIDWSGDSERWSCPMRLPLWTFSDSRNVKPVKACREAEKGNHTK